MKISDSNIGVLKTIIILIALLIVVSCSISIFNNGIYKDGIWANAQWLGQDIVTLMFSPPLLIISFFMVFKKRCWKWKIILCGMFLYLVYTYAFYMFAAKLTFLYLFHLPIFSLAVFGFFLLMMDLFHQYRHPICEGNFLRIAITGYLLMISLMLIFIWSADIFSHLSIPGYRSDTPDGQAPLIIYSLDFAIIIPLMILSAIGYLRKRSYGFILTGVILIKTSLLGFALMGMSLSMVLQKLKTDLFLISLWCVIGILGTILSILYFNCLKKRTVSGGRESMNIIEG